MVTATPQTESLRSNPIADGTRVNTYRNLNLMKAGIVGWSIQTKVHGKWKVMQHARCVLMCGVTFKNATASQSARVKEQVREVCAWLKGDFMGSCLSRPTEEAARWNEPPSVSDVLDKPRRLYCCPKQDDGVFKDFETREPLESAAYVFVDGEGKAWYAEKLKS